MPSPLAPPLALALVLSLAATAHAGETANTGALTDCLVPPCEDSIGSCPAACVSAHRRLHASTPVGSCFVRSVAAG